jgi:[ribosomal protein S18]-alanine N-acetyltransferase
VTPVIRSATPADALLLVEIERRSFPNATWDRHSFFKHTCVVAEIQDRVAGFLVSREIFPALDGTLAEREILNLAVAPSYRRLGVATALLKHELSREATHFLEVRESNVAARALYRKCGFVEVGRRAGYYEFPTETAIVMSMKKC